ncbi:energy transducer TonB [Hyphobacterium sp.]|uniref:energy transducer TonB n=1 Tax=Hyphobacterium sp. TaxID=2004662 RepID=UPI00374973CE
MRFLIGILASVLLASAALGQGLPSDVAEAYRGYESAVDAENWADAAYQAERAWRAAEAGDVDAATTTILAANYGEVALIVGNNAGAAEAYERAAELSHDGSIDVQTTAGYLRLAAQSHYLAGNYRSARNLSTEAVGAFDDLPISDARWTGLYQSQMIRAFAHMQDGNAVRGGRFAQEALEALAYIGPIANDETASLAFLAGLNAAVNRQASEAAYYFTLTSYINDEIAAGDEASRIAIAWASYMRGEMSADERAELISRLENSGFRPASCSIGQSSCYETPEWINSFGPDAVVVDAEPDRRLPPRYPADAAAGGLEGTVLLRYTVSVEGRATDIETIFSVPNTIFADASEAVLRRWRFTPAMVDGEPVERPGKYVQFDFQLSNQ